MKKIKCIVKKVPIEQFINVLQDAYMLGANFVDVTLISVGSEERDHIVLNIQEDYYEEDNTTSMEDIDYNDLIV